MALHQKTHFARSGVSSQEAQRRVLLVEDGHRSFASLGHCSCVPVSAPGQRQVCSAPHRVGCHAHWSACRRVGPVARRPADHCVRHHAFSLDANRCRHRCEHRANDRLRVNHPAAALIRSSAHPAYSTAPSQNERSQNERSQTGPSKTSLAEYRRAERMKREARRSEERRVGKECW